MPCASVSECMECLTQQSPHGLQCRSTDASIARLCYLQHLLVVVGCYGAGPGNHVQLNSCVCDFVQDCLSGYVQWCSLHLCSLQCEEMQAMVQTMAARRQLPARLARTTKKLVEVVSSSESDGDPSDNASSDDSD